VSPVSLVDDFAAFVGRVESEEGAWVMGEKGPPVVLLHGIAGGRRLFFRIVPRLAERFRVIVPILHGEARPAPTATLADLLDDLALLLERLDLREVRLLGTSFGGYVALAYARRRDPRVKELIVQGAFPRYRLRLMDRVVLALSHLVPASVASAYFVHRVLHGREIRLLARHAPGMEPLVAGWQGKTPFASLRRRTHLIAGPALQVPDGLSLTIAHGGEDAVVPREAFEKLKRACPRARAVLWDGVGHMAPLTHPELVAGLVS
jgi:pimeloyl-ACP methyl ester carboxylesterase